MKSLKTDQRVLVKQDDHGIALNATGTVARMRRDGGAWIALDERSKVEAVHPFAAEDSRGTHVLAYPEDCELATGTSAERRIAERAADRPVPTLATFGQDHWSTFAYVETRVVDHSGRLHHEHLRCDRKRHPLMAHFGSMGAPSPTRLHGGELLADHDDWDCLDDLERAGLLLRTGSGMHPSFQLSLEGIRVASLLRAHKMHGGTFGSFVVRPLAERTG